MINSSPNNMTNTTQKMIKIRIYFLSDFLTKTHMLL